ncbi:hypothetical protein HU200_004431 [Digitaria exilis]|uniref:Uncharacterized protein n=1 Tax=Digitaria exilis TaxID=1010633 RepID=A0A835FTG7_9POAL|nr:hypothetical protein HU200_004431 [Digitaria exilis]
MLPSRRSYRERGNGPWLLRYLLHDDEDGYKEDGQGKLEWSSVMEDDPESQDEAGGCNGDVDERYRILELMGQYIDFLGFHPYKEVVFFHHRSERAIAYHLSCSKIQDMGTLSLRRTTESIEIPFPYTPCWLDVFPENK